jgi:hypothetical protein
MIDTLESDYDELKMEGIIALTGSGHDMFRAKRLIDHLQFLQENFNVQGSLGHPKSKAENRLIIEIKR